MERLAKDPLYFAKPDRVLFQDIRRFFAITAPGAGRLGGAGGLGEQSGLSEEQIEAGALDGGSPLPRDDPQGQAGASARRCPERDYCPSHQHLESTRVAA